MVSVIRGQSHESGAGIRLAAPAGSTKTFSIPIKPSPTVKLCSLVASFCCSTFHLRHDLSFKRLYRLVYAVSSLQGKKMKPFYIKLGFRARPVLASAQPGPPAAPPAAPPPAPAD